MSDETLAEMLERTADRTEVGAPPMNQMYAAAQRSRRRRGAWTALAAAAAVATVIGGLAVLSPGSDGKTPVAEPGLVTPAPGMRLVGIKNVVIEVPEEWGTNELRCGTPQADTVVIDQGLTPACGWSRPAVVSSVKITRDGRDVAAKWEQIEVDGVKASRAEIPCTHYFDVGGGMSDICRSAVEFPEQDVQFLAEVSNPDLDQARAEVDEILSRIRVLPEGQWTMPPSNAYTKDWALVDDYVATLESMGVAANIERVPVSSSKPDGAVLQTDPPVGSPVARGDEVTVTVVGDPAKNTTAPKTEETEPPSNDASDTPEPRDVPAGMRLVGIGPISVTVPNVWGTNNVSCGSTPTQNTVNISGAEFDCLATHPDDVASVNLRGSDWSDSPGKLGPATIDGTSVQRKDYCKNPANPPARRVHRDTAQGQPRCMTTIVHPSGATIEIGSNATGSSLSDSSAARAQVAEIVARVRINEDWVGVPATPATYSGWRADFRNQLESMGLRAEFIDMRGNSSRPAGSLRVVPAPGSVVRRGSVITATRYSK